MEVAAQRRLAAKILKCGKSRIWMDPAKLGEIAQAITAADVRRLIGSGVIREEPKSGVSRSRARYIAEQKRAGRRKGKGSRKGALGARFRRKSAWMNAIRAQRAMLKELLISGKIDKKTYKQMYRKSGGGYFRSRAHIKACVEELTKAPVEAREKAAKKKHATETVSRTKVAGESKNEA
ncbi:MAG: 50S ribosomal protein L19e [Candidatus Aenigmatarchaeota archaeon]